MAAAAQQLKRQVGLFGALMLGLGSMVGTGIFFVSWQVATEMGVWIFPVILAAGLLALCNGLSSAQLAANFPVSGGTYEYGCRLLSPFAGFAAGWAFLLAKSASAAAACVVAGQLLGRLLEIDLNAPYANLRMAVLIWLSLTVAVLFGLRRTQILNTTIVVCSTAAIFAEWILVAMDSSFGMQLETAPATGTPIWAAVPGAIALIFVGFTGYGRVATLGEEILDPRRNIPKAVMLTVAAAGLLYALVPLAVSGREPSIFFQAGAIIALCGIVLNLLLGLSRMLLAMSRRQDMPAGFARLNRSGEPNRAIIGVALLIGAFMPVSQLGALTENIWAFSAFTVLVYYGFANLCALRLTKAQRLYPPAIAIAGLAGCVGLLPFIQWPVILASLAILALGFALRAALQSGQPASDSESPNDA
ncbi:MAG: APC family permease [Opitutales bacterium]